jgi:hypothetical protein
MDGDGDETDGREEHAGAPEGVDGDAPGAPAFAGGGGTASALREHWEELLGDMSDIADGYRDSGWGVLELHPGDVTVVTESRRGLDVLVPDDEFAQLEGWVADGTFPEHEVYRAEAGLVFLLVVLRNPADERAVCCPSYYPHAEAERLRGVAEAEGRLYTHVRNLAEEYVTFTHEEPAEFFPAEG